MFGLSLKSLLVAALAVGLAGCNKPVKKNWKSPDKKTSPTPPGPEGETTPDGTETKPEDSQVESTENSEESETVGEFVTRQIEKVKKAYEEASASAEAPTKVEADGSESKVAQNGFEQELPPSASQSVEVVAEPISKIKGTELGDGILSLSLAKPDANGQYPLSFTTQYFILYLVDDSGRLTEGQNPAELAMKSLFENPMVELAQNDLAQIQVLRAQMEVAGLVDEEVSEKFQSFAASVENRVASLNVERESGLAATHLGITAISAAVFWIAPPVVRNQIKAKSHQIISQLDNAAQAGRVASRLDNIALGIPDDVLKKMVTLKRFPFAINEMKGTHSFDKVGDARNYMWRLLDLITGVKSQMLKGPNSPIIAYGREGIELIPVSGKQFVFSWKNKVYRESVSKMQFKPTNIPGLDYAVKNAEDGGAILLRQTDESGTASIVMFISTENDTVAEKAVGLTFASRREMGPEATTEALRLSGISKNFAQLEEGFRNSSSNLIGLLSTRNERVKEIATNIKAAYFSRAGAKRAAIGMAAGAIGGATPYFFYHFEEMEKLDGNAILKALQSEDSFAPLTNEPAATVPAATPDVETAAEATL